MCRRNGFRAVTDSRTRAMNDSDVTAFHYLTKQCPVHFRAHEAVCPLQLASSLSDAGPTPLVNSRPNLI